MFGEHVVTKQRHVTAFQLAGAFIAWKGLADYSWRTSLIVAGVAVIAILEIRT